MPASGASVGAAPLRASHERCSCGLAVGVAPMAWPQVSTPPCGLAVGGSPYWWPWPRVVTCIGALATANRPCKGLGLANRPCRGLGHGQSPLPRV
ncbi:hypothetical protein GW17_00055388 [Ensete ventricosum]|nr:hypothetical protein GW17_00055388 [Ensete ventricosum]RZS25699.1 hypothetical protein BHM03_00058940 [Ensete ventricosum]